MTKYIEAFNEAAGGYPGGRPVLTVSSQRAVGRVNRLTEDEVNGVRVSNILFQPPNHLRAKCITNAKLGSDSLTGRTVLNVFLRFVVK